MCSRLSLRAKLQNPTYYSRLPGPGLYSPGPCLLSTKCQLRKTIRTTNVPTFSGARFWKFGKAVSIAFEELAGSGQVVSSVPSNPRRHDRHIGT